MTVLVDTHALHWWSAEPDRLSETAAAALSDADELAVADITWWELAWLAQNGRIRLTVPIRSWLDALSRDVRSIGVTPAIAISAVSLPETFPGDPADRLIYATAIEYGWRLVTKDQRLHEHPNRQPITIW